MKTWNDNLKLEDDELITSYSSSFFNAEIQIRLTETDDKVHPKQEQIISEIIENEQKWIEKAILSLIEFYKEAYADYKKGWEIGGADEMTIEKYLPKNIDETKLIKLITPSEIFIPPEEECSEGRFGFGLECEWDEEHDLGVFFDNWNITETGGMDVAFCF